MKKIIYTCTLLLTYLFINGQTNSNPMLTSIFWEQKPDIEIIMNEIVKGHSASEANRGNHDVVSFAINNDAPLESILFLISQQGNSIDKITHDGRLYIHWAALNGNTELVDYLIKQGSDIYRTDDKGATPISFAAGASQTNTSIYDLFFEAGINPKQQYKDGTNLIHLSIAGDKDLKLTEYFISKGISLKDVDDYGRTAFDFAARGGDIQLLKRISERGIKPTQSAVIIAAQGSRWKSNNLEIFNYLLDDLKLPANAKGIEGENALHYFAKKREDQTENIALFMSKGLDINETDHTGTNAFTIAASTSNTDLIKKWLPHLKNINIKNKNGETPLVFAVRSGSSEMVEVLIDNGADVNTQAKEGNLAYYLIQSYRPARPEETSDEFAKKMEILSKKNVDFVTPQPDGNTLYHIAVNKNDLHLFKKLETLNIDVNTINKEGLTALHKAALTGKDERIMKFLIANGANKAILTEFDESAYDIASENETLIEKQIDLSFLK